MRAWIFVCVTASTTIGGYLVLAWVMIGPAAIPDTKAAAPEVHDVISDVLSAREASYTGAGGEVPFGADDEINILALGIDSRKEGKEQHCDAIHMVTLHLKDWSIDITSVPRGTYAYIPGKHAPSDYYLANACAFEGLDYGVAQIEKVVGVKADYVATVGFSQALGIFRLLHLPTTDTLQWLRHRQSYAIGDPQRSENQAVFMKDVAIKILGGDGISTPFLYILYHLVDTDLTFGQVKDIYSAYRASDLADRPDDIRLAMKPFFDVKEYHLDTDNPDAQVQDLVDKLKGRLSPDDLSLKTVDEIQAELVSYLDESLNDPAEAEHIYTEQLWSQVEDPDKREEFNYQYLEKHVDAIKVDDPQAAQNAVSDYILEKEYLGLTDWETAGKGLLTSLIESE